MGILSFQILYGRPNPDDTREVRNQNPYWKYPRGHTYGHVFVSTKICTAKSIISTIKIVRFSVYSFPLWVWAEECDDVAKSRVRGESLGAYEIAN